VELDSLGQDLYESGYMWNKTCWNDIVQYMRHFGLSREYYHE